MEVKAEKDAKDDEVVVRNFLQKELSKDFQARRAQAAQAVPSTGARTSEAASADQGRSEPEAARMVAPPRAGEASATGQRSGAMASASARGTEPSPGLSHLLERRAHDWKAAAQLLEHQRHLLKTVELERDRLFSELESLTPEVDATSRDLRIGLMETIDAETSKDLTAEFARNAEAVERLEKLGSSLAANALWLRSNWEQYARSLERAKRLKAELTSMRG